MFRIGRNKKAHAAGAEAAADGTAREQAGVREIPPIDLDVPDRVETATFALG